MYSRYSIALVALLAASIAGCATNPVSEPVAGTFGTAPASGQRPATRVLLNERCPIQREAFAALLIPLAIAVGKEAIEQGIALASEAIDRYEEEHKGSFSATRSGAFYIKEGEDLAFRFQCITVLRGIFGDEIVSGSESGDWTNSLMQSLNLVQPPAFAFETLLIQDATLEHFALVPTRLEFREPAALRGRTKDLKITIGVLPPAATLEAAISKAIGTAEFVFTKMPADGRAWDREMLASRDSQWIPVPKLTTAAQNAANGSELGPITVAVTVQEDEKLSDAFAFGKGLFTGTKDDLTTFLRGGFESLVNQAAGDEDAEGEGQ